MKKVRDLCADIHRMLLIEDAKTQRHPAFTDWRSHIVNVSMLPPAMQRCNATPIKTLMACVKELEQNQILRFVWNHKRP